MNSNITLEPPGTPKNIPHPGAIAADQAILKTAPEGELPLDKNQIMNDDYGYISDDIEYNLDSDTGSFVTQDFFDPPAERLVGNKHSLYEKELMSDAIGYISDSSTDSSFIVGPKQGKQRKVHPLDAELSLDRLDGLDVPSVHLLDSHHKDIDDLGDFSSTGQPAETPPTKQRQTKQGPIEGKQAKQHRHESTVEIRAQSIQDVTDFLGRGKIS